MQLDLALIPGLPGYAEILIVLFVGLLLFGKRLPEVARSLGRSVVEFKKGVRDIRDDVDRSSDESKRRLPESDRGGALPSQTVPSQTVPSQTVDAPRQPAEPAERNNV